jgi:hypothetical protein
MLDDNQMVYPERHCCPDALSEIRMMKAMSSDIEEIPCLSWLQNKDKEGGINGMKGNFFCIFVAERSQHLESVSVCLTESQCVPMCLTCLSDPFRSVTGSSVDLGQGRSRSGRMVRERGAVLSRLRAQ